MKRVKNRTAAALADLKSRHRCERRHSHAAPAAPDWFWHMNRCPLDPQQSEISMAGESRVLRPIF